MAATKELNGPTRPAIVALSRLNQEDPWRRTLSAQAPAVEIRHALMDQLDQLPAVAGVDVTAMTGEIRLKSLDPGGWMAAQAQSMAVTT